MATQDMQSTLNMDSRTSAGDITKWLQSVPPMAKVTVKHTPGDRPFEAGTDRITARWTQSVEGT